MKKTFAAIAAMATSLVMAVDPVAVGTVSTQDIGTINEGTAIPTSVTFKTIQGGGDVSVTEAGGVITVSYSDTATSLAPAFDYTTAVSNKLELAVDDLCDATNALQSAKADKATTLAGYGITDAKITNGTISIGGVNITPLTSFTETDPNVHEWAKAESKPSYNFSEIGSTPTTLSGYGITDAVPSTRTINGAAISTNIVLNASHVGAIASDALAGENWANDGITGKISNLHETIIAVEKLIEALGGTAPVDAGN